MAAVSRIVHPVLSRPESAVRRSVLDFHGLTFAERIDSENTEGLIAMVAEAIRESQGKACTLKVRRGSFAFGIQQTGPRKKATG